MISKGCTTICGTESCGHLCCGNKVPVEYWSYVVVHMVWLLVFSVNTDMYSYSHNVTSNKTLHTCKTVCLMIFIMQKCVFQIYRHCTLLMCQCSSVCNVLTLTTTCDSISRIVDYAGTLEAARCICAQSIPITVVHSSCTFINF